MVSTVRRRLVTWQATHDNGWISVIAEQPDATYIAWAGGAESFGADHVADTLEHAQAAALFALKRKSGHGTCSLHCSGWEMHTHEMIVAGPDGAERGASRPEEHGKYLRATIAPSR